jgi:hypothetical protein
MNSRELHALLTGSAPSLLDDLGRVRRVKGKPADTGRFASWTRRPRPKGGSYEEGQGMTSARDSRDRPAPEHDHRAISVQLARVNQGQSWVLAVHGPGWSADPAGRIHRIPS